MLPSPSCTLTFNPKTPVEVNRLALLTSTQINNDSTLTPQDQLIARPASTTPAHSDTESANTPTHPKGSLIFHHDVIVSTQNITERHTALADHILSQCGDSVARPPVMMFLEISGHDHQADYYVVVHKSKTIAWVVDQVPESFKGATQAEHEHEHWIHMENFPGPQFSTPEDLRSLKHVLGSDAIDALTSEGSTSPMSVERIKTYLAMLNPSSGEGDVYQTYVTARLWNLTLQNKYGTHVARFNDRCIKFSDNPPTPRGRHSTLVKPMFGRIHAHLGRCSGAWADRNAYTEEWRRSNSSRPVFRAPEFVNEGVIGSATVVEDIISALTRRGCLDLTSSIDLTACNDRPCTGGGCCDMYRGAMHDGTKIAIKSLRIYDSSQLEGNIDGRKALKRAARELYHWSKLKHRNVLPLMGLAIFKGYLSMISGWMENGDMTSYLKQNPDADRIRLCMDICEGLCHIHANEMVHGDLKGANIMISSNGVAMIADFGNSQLKELTLKFSNTTSRGLSIRWAAPEVLEAADPSREADVYAYGMTVLETLTGKAPYHEHSDPQVIRLVTVNKKVPPRPNTGMCDELWRLLNSCWAQSQSERPRITSIRDRLGVLALRHSPIQTCNQCSQPPLSEQTEANLKSTTSLEQNPNCWLMDTTPPTTPQAKVHVLAGSTPDPNIDWEKSEQEKSGSVLPRIIEFPDVVSKTVDAGVIKMVHRKVLHPAWFFGEPFRFRALILPFIVFVLCGLYVGAFRQSTEPGAALGSSTLCPIIDSEAQEIRRLRKLLEAVGQSSGNSRNIVYCGCVQEADKDGNVHSQIFVLLNAAELNVERWQAYRDCFTAPNTSS